MWYLISYPKVNSYDYLQLVLFKFNEIAHRAMLMAFILWCVLTSVTSLLLSNPLWLTLRDMKSTFDASLPGCSSYFGDTKVELGNASQYDQARPECNGLNQLTADACMGVQIDEPYSFSLYGDINLPEPKAMQDCAVKFQGNPMNYRIAGPQDLPMSMFDTKSQPWVPSELPKFNENLYPQVSFH